MTIRLWIPRLLHLESLYQYDTNTESSFRCEVNPTGIFGLILDNFCAIVLAYHTISIPTSRCFE